MKRFLSMCVVCLCLVSIALAAGFWTKKPYEKWSQEEAVHMLTDSPWAKSTTLSNGVLSNNPVTGARAEDTQQAPAIRYSVSIASAMPVREAHARLAEISNKYDKMNAQQKQEFEGRIKQYLDAKFPDVILVAVDFRSNDASLDHQLTNYFQGQKLETMKSTTALVLADGKKIELAAFAASEHELQMTFPRSPELASAASFSIVFEHPNVTGFSGRPITNKFDLKDMTFSGAAAF